MNIELIIKLVKLANNNPNEHEANAAARKVCRLIAEANFKFNNDRPIEPKQKPLTWEDIVRSTEPMWRSQPYDPSADPFRGASFYSGIDWNYNPYVQYKEKQRSQPTDKKCTKCGQIKSTIRKIDPFVCGTCEWEQYNKERMGL